MQDLLFVTGAEFSALFVVSEDAFGQLFRKGRLAGARNVGRAGWRAPLSSVLTFGRAAVERDVRVSEGEAEERLRLRFLPERPTRRPRAMVGNRQPAHVAQAHGGRFYATARMTASNGRLVTPAWRS